MRIMLVTSWNYPVSVRRHIKDTCFFSFQFNLMSPRATKRNGGCYYIALVGDPLPLWEGVGGGEGFWGGGLLTPSTSLGGYKTESSAGFLPNHPDRPALHLPHQTSKVKCCSHQSCDSSSPLAPVFSLLRWRGDWDCAACRSSSARLFLRPSASSSP